jgi:serine/threonine protein kinase
MRPKDSVLQNRYRIIANLAVGGMGAVYQALDERLDAIVAIKERTIEGVDIQRAFSREASLLANLNHPALPVVTDHFFEEERQFLVMRYIPGKDLAEALKSQGKPFPVSIVVDWADHLLDALEYLHNHNPPIVHRDIKPANLKIGERGQIMLLDFGLAKGARGQMSTWVPGGTIAGFTRNYAPLEQINGFDTDPRSDIYSLGATLYHLMTGTVAVDASKRYCEIDGGNPDPFTNATLIESQIPAQLCDVLTRAMSLSRAERIPTASQMRQALKECTLQKQNQEVASDERGDNTQAPLDPTLVVAPRQLKFEYWTRLNQILRNNNSLVRLRPVKPTFQVTGFIGHPQVQLFASISIEHNRLTVGLRILNRKDIYRALVRERQTIESEINGLRSEQYRWREQKSVQTVSEITVTRLPEDIRWRERWPENLAWHHDRLEAFYKAFDPRVRKFQTTDLSSNRRVPASHIREEVERFWNEFEAQLAFAPDLLQLNKPYISPNGRGKSWKNKSLGKGFIVAVQLNASKSYVDVNITVRPAHYASFVKIHLQRATIETQTGRTLEWRLNPNGESSAIARRPFDLEDSATWKPTYKWLLETLRIFVNTFSPRIQNLDSSLSLDKQDMAVIQAYLCDGWSHRRIEKEILLLPALERGGGYVAMSILRKYGITGEHKSHLKGRPFRREVFEAAGNIHEYLRRTKS